MKKPLPSTEKQRPLRKNRRTGKPHTDPILARLDELHEPRIEAFRATERLDETDFRSIVH